MKLVRSLLIGLIAVLAVVALSVGVLLMPAVQTWLVHRQLAARPDLHLTIGRVAVGFRHVVLTEVSFTSAATQIHAPVVTADMDSLTALLYRRFDVSSLTARGWTAQFAAAAATGAARPLPTPGAAEPLPSAPAVPGARAVARGSSAPANAPTGAARLFSGVFDSLRLPVDMSVDAVDLQGRVSFPRDGGHTDLRVTGGGIGAGRTAKFTVTSSAVVGRGPITATNVSGLVTATMDSPRTLTDVAVKLHATATGPTLDQPLGFDAELAARRRNGGESYELTVARGPRQLVVLHAELPASHHLLRGIWALDIRDADVATLAEGRQLPTFTAAGQGKWEAEPGFANVQAAGQLDATFDNLAALSPEFSGIGPMKVNADVDLARRGGVFAVTKLNLAFSGAEPVATVRALQAFQFNPATGELQPTDGTRELVGIELQGLPLAWARPFAPGFTLAGRALRGELVATPRAGGFTFRARVPLTVAGLDVDRGGEPLVRGVDLSLSASGDYTPQGWQAELNGMAGGHESPNMVRLNAKAGQLAGAGQPVKATGRLAVDLGALAAQPAAQAIAGVKRGSATAEFAASFGRTTELQAKVASHDVVAAAGGSTEPLPEITGTVRADIAADHRVTLSMPITLARAGRTSDLAIAGSFTPSSKGGVFNADVSSKNLVLDDARAFALLLPASTKAAGDHRPAPWAGFDGTAAVQLKHVVSLGKFEMTNVTGKVRVSGGTLTLDNLHGGLGQGGDALVSGAIKFDPSAAEPFTLGADVALTDFDPGPLILAANPGEPPAIEGRFTVTTKVTATAATLGGLPRAITGDFALTSKSGVFRGLPVNVGNLVENSGKLASWLASAGNAITSLGGRKDYDEITSRSEAANELAKILSAITYDQLGMVVSRDAAQNLEVKQLTLISPELRITGSGRAHRVPEHSFLNDGVELDLQLRARGRPAELMKYLGVLDGKPDDLGYSACTIPVRVEGSLVKLDTTQLSNRLVALAVEKTGLTEKAVDWINRLRGKSTN